jgi:hypothetical protein
MPVVALSGRKSSKKVRALLASPTNWELQPFRDAPFVHPFIRSSLSRQPEQPFDWLP